MTEPQTMTEAKASTEEGQTSSTPVVALAVEEIPTRASVKGNAKRKTKSKPPLLFIDTNILLDFYRTRNDAGISLLRKIDDLHDHTITTCQLEMEFKKNRQKVISDSISGLQPPNFSLPIPAFLSDAATVKVIKGRIQDVKKRVEKLKGRVLATMENPKTRDRIYQTIQRLFNHDGSLNLRHDSPEYKQVWRRALRRFLEGRPPRKKEDTSAGDAINWEWIIQCAKIANRDVVIVSRDADYGLTLDSKGYANNWLTDEFKERVNKQRKLILVDRLSSALRLLDVKVTPEEISSERAIINATTGAHISEIEGLVCDALDDLLNEDEIASLIARTNTSGWALDTFDLENETLKKGVWTANASFSFSGEQEDDKPWCGNIISGRCVVLIDEDKQVTFSEVEASLDSDEEPDEPPEGEPDEHEPDEHEPDEHEPDEHEPDEHEPDEHEPDEHEPDEHEPDEHEPDEHEPA